MGSRLRLWEVYGQAWGWLPETMTVEEDREDLARHAVGSQLEAALAEHLPRWLSQAWPFPDVWYGIESPAR